MKRVPHLVSAVVACFLALSAAIAFDFYALNFEAKYVNSLVALDISPILNGSAIQRAAFHQSDLLPVFGNRFAHQPGRMDLCGSNA